jgi:hypothetical protein
VDERAYPILCGGDVCGVKHTFEIGAEEEKVIDSGGPGRFAYHLSTKGGKYSEIFAKIYVREKESGCLQARSGDFSDREDDPGSLNLD